MEDETKRDTWFNSALQPQLTGKRGDRRQQSKCEISCAVMVAQCSHVAIRHDRGIIRPTRRLATLRHTYTCLHAGENLHGQEWISTLWFAQSRSGEVAHLITSQEFDMQVMAKLCNQCLSRHKLEYSRCHVRTWTSRNQGIRKEVAHLGEAIEQFRQSTLIRTSLLMSQSWT
jgi:hypothetical protein